MNYSNHTKGSASRGTVAPPFYMMGQVETEYPRMIVPQPGGIYNLYAPHNKEASFVNNGIRQWNTASHPGGLGKPNFGGGNVAVPTKCKYDPYRKVLDEQAEMRENEFLGRYITVSEKARELLRQTFAQKYGNADEEMVRMYMMNGATEEQAKEMVEKERLTKFASSKYKNRVGLHVSAKNAIHDLAESRGLRIGLPGSLATFAGVTQPQINYSGKEVAGIKRVLDASIKKVDAEYAKESMIGQKPPSVSAFGAEGAVTSAFTDRYDVFLRDRLADEVEREAGVMFNEDAEEELARLLGVHADRPNRANVQLQTGGGIGADNAVAGAGGAGVGVVPGRAGRPPGGGIIELPPSYEAYVAERASRGNTTTYDARIFELAGINVPPAGTPQRKRLMDQARQQLRAKLG
jgi:hypothetical protein